MCKKIKLLTLISLFFAIWSNCLNAKEIKALVRIPFTTNGKQTYMKLKMNGSKEDLCFVFDTGAGGTVIDRYFLTAGNITLTGEKEELETAMNVVQVDISKNNTLHFHHFDLSGVKIYIENLAHLTPAPDGNKVAGIVGYDMMKNYVTYINHEKNYIELYPKGTILYPKAKEMNFTMYQNELPAFEATIQTENNTYPVKLIFDSGAGMASSLTTNFIAKYNLENELKVKVKIPVIGGAQSSTSVNYLSSLHQITFSNFTFQHVPVNFSTSTSGASASDSIDGVIGFDLIKRFNVVLDYEHRIIKLIPNKNYKNPFDFNLTGLNLKTVEHQVVVMGVLDYSPAKKAGILEGDVILSVDGKTYTYAPELRSYLKGSFKPKKIVFKRGDKTFQLTLKPERFY